MAKSSAERISIIAAYVIAVSGCATTYAPKDKHELNYLERAQTQTKGKVEVTVSVLSAEESEELFGVPIAERGIQPVWIRIRNNEEAPYFFYPLSLDPEYFSAHEAAWRNRFSFSDAANEEMNTTFRTHQIHPFVSPNHTTSGFVFTNIDEGIKAVNVDLFSPRHDHRNFLFTVSVPGMAVDSQDVDLDTVYAEYEITHIEDPDELRAWIEGLPCCVFGEDGVSTGDPLNLVVITQEGAIAAAFLARGWHVTEVTSASSVWKTVKSFLFGSQYRYSPISPLYLFGREQDFALQKARETVDERNHLRLWLAPVRYRGMRVFVGQISRDIGVRFTGKLWPLTTHVIDPEVDEARYYLAQDLMSSQKVAMAGLAKGVGEIPPDKPSYNLYGDPYYTDGLRLVAVFTDKPTSMVEIEYLPWVDPPDVRYLSEQ